MKQPTLQRELWSSRGGFILANIGSAVGLGSIWKFPYEVGSNGGAAFVLFYLLGLTLIVFPLMLVELSVGRRGSSDAVQSIAVVAAANRARRGWAVAGAIGIIASFLILSFYSVIGGWAIEYFTEIIRHGLAGDRATVQSRYEDILASPMRMGLYHALFMAITALIVARGVATGIEAASKIIMPLLILLIVMLAIYSAIEGDLAATLRFFFALDTDMITPRIVLEALGLGFFSIGVGLGVMITYAAYAKADVNLREVAIITVISDTAISFLAGFAVFPIVFAERLDPSSGPGLIFVTLPLAFTGMPFGTWTAGAFFLLLAIAAVASAISMLEMSVALTRRCFGWSRPTAAMVCASVCWVTGLASVLSFNVWSGWYPLAAFPGLATATLFHILDHLTSNALLPLAGFLLAIFGGWVVPESVLMHELGVSRSWVSRLRFLLRFVAPIGIATASIAPVVL